MNKGKIPKSEPDMVSWATNPDGEKALGQLHKSLYEYGLWKLVDTYAKKKNIPYAEYVESLDKEALLHLEKEAHVQVMKLAGGIKDIGDRTEAFSQYEILSKNIHHLVGEYDTFIEFLEAETDENTGLSRSTYYERKFLLELVDAFKGLGYKDYVKEVFGHKLVYRKMTASIPTLKAQYNALQAAQMSIKAKEDDLAKEKSKYLKEVSDMRSRGEEVKKIDAEMKKAKEVDKKIETLHEQSKPSLENLEHTLVAFTTAAADIAKSSNIPRSEVSQMLPNVAKVYLKKAGLVPEEVAPQIFAKETVVPEKPEVFISHNGTKSYLWAEIPKNKIALIEKMLQPGFDVRLSTIEETSKTMANLVSDKTLEVWLKERKAK